MMPTLCFDLDGALFLREKDNDYEKSKPNEAVISMVNELHTLDVILNYTAPEEQKVV